MSGIKGKVAAAAAGIIIGGTGTGLAAASFNGHAYGVWCKSDARSQSVACVKDNGRGYGVAISKDLVVVLNLATGKRVFTRFHNSGG